LCIQHYKNFNFNFFQQKTLLLFLLITSVLEQLLLNKIVYLLTVIYARQTKIIIWTSVLWSNLLCQLLTVNFFFFWLQMLTVNLICNIGGHVYKQVFICSFVICDCSTTISGWVFMISVGFNAAARLDSWYLNYLQILTKLFII
jgi:hypothetical protein